MEETVLAKIRIQRIILGYSQYYLAQELKITQSQYSRLENGVNKISSEQLEQIYAVLKIEKSSGDNLESA